MSRAAARTLVRLAGIYALATACGALLWRVGAPLPWMIGPILGAAALGLSGIDLRIPVKTRPVGQIVIATNVGLYFTPHAVAVALESLPILVGSALFTAFLGYLASIALARLTGLDRTCAFLASVPNGPVEMANLAQHFAVDPGPVAFAQTLRIAAIVVLVPIAIYTIHGRFEAASGFPAAPFDPVGLVVLAVLATAAAALARRVKLSNPFFLGPLLLTALLTATGVELSRFPIPILILAQVLLGTWLGSTFRRELLQRAGRLVSVLVVTTLVFVVACTVGVGSLALVTDLSWETLVLGSAPGGVTEMALTADALGQDVALITAFHIVRIFLIMPNIPWVVARLHGRRPAGGT